MNKLRVFFNNILPATFVDSYTYIEQIRILKNKLNVTDLLHLSWIACIFQGT